MSKAVKIVWLVVGLFVILSFLGCTCGGVVYYIMAQRVELEREEMFRGMGEERWKEDQENKKRNQLLFPKGGGK